MQAQSVKSPEAAHKLVSVVPSMPANEAIRLMDEKGIHHLVVLQGDKFLGVVSYRTLASAVLGEGWLGAARVLTVGEMMRTNVPVVSETTELGEAVHAMIHSGISVLPIVDSHKKVVGVLTESDLLKLIDSLVHESHPVRDAVLTGKSWVSTPAFQKLLATLSNAGL